MFLSASELERLTGYQRASAQIRWLRAHGYRFTVNGYGVPVVAVAEASRHMVGGKASKEEPNWDALKAG